MLRSGEDSAMSRSTFRQGCAFPEIVDDERTATTSAYIVGTYETTDMTVRMKIFDGTHYFYQDLLPRFNQNCNQNISLRGISNARVLSLA